MLYEIHNPAAYILPDVVCNWEQVKMVQLDANRVLVHGTTCWQYANQFPL
jgi:hypothetical protein